MEKTIFKNVKNVNSGVDRARIQENKPSFFVSWTDESGNHYEFFSIVSARDNLKNRLLNYEIEDEYKRMGNSLSEKMPFSNGKYWQALSQYGYPLKDGFTSEKEASNYALNYYKDGKMHLIRQ